MARNGMPDDLIRRTMPPERPVEPADDQTDGESNGELNGESRGGVTARKTRTRSGRRIAPGDKIRGRKFQMPDSVFERLCLHALKRKTNPSAIVAELLDRHVPKHRIQTDE
jgi:hypothetical protein